VVTVREVIEDLQQLDPDLVVAVDADEEGNNTRLAHGVDTAYVVKLQYQYMETLHPDDIDEYKEDYELSDDWKPTTIAVIW
jgi:hypothetical protein